ncbi:MAG: YdiY family protein [Novosphingobium sp.]
MAPAQPAALPDGVAAMIDTALASPDRSEAEAVIRTAKRALPDLEAAIDAHVAQWSAIRQAAIMPASPAAAAGSLSPDNKQDAAAAAAAAAAETGPALAAALKWTGEGEAGAFVNTGNAPGIGLVGAFKLRVEGDNWRVATNARADYQETAGLVTREQYRFSAEPNYKFNDRSYVFGLGQYEKDRFQGFASRYSLSGGLGYNLLNSKDNRLSIKAGPTWRVTEPVQAERTSVVAGLASLEAKIKLSETLQFSQDANAYVDGEGSTFYTLAALDSRLIGKLKARLSYMIQHETSPELGRLGTDTTSRLTLVYGF